MKHEVPLIRGKQFAIIVIVLLTAALAVAEPPALQIAPDNSTATVYLGSAGNPRSFTVGVAGISGDAQISRENISASQFDFTISQSKRIQTLRFRDDSGYGSESTITFQSTSVQQRSDGTLEVRGRLTVMQEFNGPPPGSSEDEPRARFTTSTVRSSREVTFVFSGLMDALAAGGNQGSQSMLLHGTTSVDGARFPELSLSIHDVAWPMTASSQPCAAADRAGPDASCGGSSASWTQGLPAGNLITLQLNLVLVNAG